ncbi:hypothetical protein, partial [Niveispirillum cyanobacteriorum]
MSNRLNGIIRAWEAGKPAFSCFAKADKQTAIDLSDSPYDALVFEMEHNPFDMLALGDALQYLLNRKQIHTAPTLAPAVTPIVRIPSNGVEMNQAEAKQALDRGVYGVVWLSWPRKTGQVVKLGICSSITERGKSEHEQVDTT